MTASHQQPVSSTPEFEGIFRKRLELVAVGNLAVDTSIDSSQVGKFINGTAALRISDVSKLVRRVGLKVVDQNRVCIRPEELAFLRRLHAVVNEHAQWLLNEAEA